MRFGIFRNKNWIEKWGKAAAVSFWIRQCSGQRKTEASLPQLGSRMTWRTPGRSMNSMHQHWRLSVLPSKDTAVKSQCALIASASFDHTIKLWAFDSRQLLASFDAHKPSTLILSPNSRQLAYTTFGPSRIHICDIPPNTLSRIWPEQATRSVCNFTAYIHLWSTNSSCRPLRLNIRTALIHSTYAILFFHPSILLIIHHYCSLTRLVILLPCAVSQSHGLQRPDR